jgi:multiple sugar transport system permease protein
MATSEQTQGRAVTKRQATSSKRRFSWTPYLFILPHLIFFVAFLGWPLFYGIYTSLFEFDFSFPDYRPFIGLQNYRNLFDPASIQYADFWRSLKNTGIFVLWSLPPLVIVALLLAVLLNGNYPGRNFFRGLYFAPWSLSAVVASLLGWWIFQGQGGLANQFLGSIGLSQVPWLGALPWAWIAITLVTVWWTVGFNTIIFLAALQDIPGSLYEAASIDGANTVQKFFGITIPMLRPVIIFIVTITLIASVNLFAQPLIMTNGGPAGGTESVIMRIYTEGFGAFRMGSAAAMSILVAALLLILTAINFKVFGESQGR